MASRDYIKHLVSNTTPASIGVGDEYYDPVANKLYKILAVNGANVANVEVVLNNNATGGYTVNDNIFTIIDDTDQSKRAQFKLDGLAANTTVQYFLPSASSNTSTLVDLVTTQTLNGTKAFSGSLSATGTTINLSGQTGTVTSLGTAITTGTITIGGPAQTGTMVIDQSTATHTLNIAVGATTTGLTKTINFGTTGVAGSITNMNFGSSVVNAQGVATFDTRIVANEQVSVANTVDATSVTTGAITTTGGISAAGNIYSNKIYTTGFFYSANGLPYAFGGGGGSVSITNDVATNLNTYYPLLSFNTTSGTLATANTSSTKLYFNPSTGTLNSTVFNSLSDENKKTNIQTIPNALNIVNNIDGVTFDFVDNGMSSAGLLAQQIEAFLPQLVNTDVNGEKSLNYNGVIGVLVEAVKTLSQEVEELKKLRS